MRRAELEPVEQFAPAGELELCYEDLGDPEAEPLLLVMGLGAQLIHWPPDLINHLIDRGYRVIRFDNRDSGHSGKVDAPPAGRAAMLLGLRRGLAYPLEAMADDAVGLLDALGLRSAHLVGVSMGGMIAQVVGYRHPGRVRSLGLVMTGSGKRPASLPRMRAMGTLLGKPARSREEFVKRMFKAFDVIGSPAYPMDAERRAEFRRLLELTWERDHAPAGVARQLHAVTASGDRGRHLRGVAAPTVVIHGDSDPLVRPAAGKALARAIPGAELRLIEGMGHDMPPQLHPRLVEAIAANAERAQRGEPAPAQAA